MSLTDTYILQMIKTTAVLRQPISSDLTFSVRINNQTGVFYLNSVIVVTIDSL